MCRREYRLRGLAAGVWFRVRRVLADADRAFVISAEDARILEDAGFPAEAAGLDLEPPIRLIFAPLERIDAMSSRREIRVRLGTELLTAGAVALVRFPG